MRVDLPPTEGPTSRVEASITSFLNDLQDVTEITRQHGFRSLRIHVEVFAKSMSPESYSRMLESLCDKLNNNLQSGTNLEVYSVLLAVDAVISLRLTGDLHDDTNRNCCTRFMSFLRRIISAKSNFIVPKSGMIINSSDIWNLVLVCKAVSVLARVARHGLRLHLSPHELFDYELQLSFQWLSNTRGMTKSRQLVGILILKEFAMVLPSVLKPYKKKLLEGCFEVSNSLMVLETAGEALRAWMHHLRDEKNLRICAAFYAEIWKRVQEGSKKPQSCAGSLIALSYAIDHENRSSIFMRPRFPAACALAFCHARLECPSSEIREAVVRLMVNLAALDPQRFVENGWLEKSIQFLRSCLSESIVLPFNGKVYSSTIFAAIGNLAVAVQHHISPYVEPILPALCNALEGTPSDDSASNLTPELLLLARQSSCTSHVQKLFLGQCQSSTRKEALDCLIKLVRAAAGSAMLKHMPMLIDKMCSRGLTSTLIDAVKQIAEALPAALPIIQRRVVHFLAVENILSESSAEETLNLALTAIGIGKEYFNSFVLECVLRFVEDSPLTSVRFNAALTSLKVVLPAEINDEQIRNVASGEEESEMYTLLESRKYIPSRSQALYVQQVVTRVLRYIVAETCPLSRSEVLKALTPQFHPYLLSPHCTNAITQLLNDEELQVRRAALRLITQLARHCPIFQVLNQLPIEFLTMLESDFPWAVRIDNSILLSEFIKLATPAVKPYAKSLLLQLLVKLRQLRAAGTDLVHIRTEASQPVMPQELKFIDSLLTAAGSLFGLLSQEDLKELFPSALEVLIEYLTSDTAGRLWLKATLDCVVSLVRHSLRPVTPYQEYPTLLPSILLVMQSAPPELMASTLRCLGVLGALDPELVRKNNIVAQANNDESPYLINTRGWLDKPIRLQIMQKSLNRIRRNSNISGYDSDESSCSETTEGSSVDFFSRQVISGLLKLIDESSGAAKGVAVRVLFRVLQGIQVTQVRKLVNLVTPCLLSVIRDSSDCERIFLLQQLRVIPALVGTRSIAQQFFSTIDELLCNVAENQHNLTIQAHQSPKSSRRSSSGLIDNFALRSSTEEGLLQEIQEILGILILVPYEILSCFAQFLVPRFAMLIRGDETFERQMSIMILNSFNSFRFLLDEHTHEITPQLLRMINTSEKHLRFASLRAFHVLVLNSDLTKFVAQIVRHFCDLVQNLGPEADSIFFDILKDLRNLYPQQFASFIPVFKRLVSTSDKPQGSTIEDMFLKALPHVVTPRGSLILDERQVSRLTSDCQSVLINNQSESSPSLQVLTEGGGAVVGGPRLWLGEPALRQCWQVCDYSSSEEIESWLRRITIELIRESPISCIRACSPLAQYSAAWPFARDLLPAAFLSCWLYISDSGKMDFTHCLIGVLQSPHSALPELHQVLNLAEVMALQDEPLLIDLDILARVAERCHAYAKALRYRELDWVVNPEECVTPLIGLYHSLQQQDAAMGVLNYAKKHLNTPLKGVWSEKLCAWTAALEAYELQYLQHPDSLEWLEGRMRCLYALGHWDKVSVAAKSAWNGKLSKDTTGKLEIASIAAAAELNLRNYQQMSFYARQLQEGYKKSAETYTDFRENDSEGSSFESAFFGAIAKLKEGDLYVARKLISSARAVLAVEFSALLGESYARAYRSLIKVQQLAELEEVMELMQLPENHPRRKEIKIIWAQRLLEVLTPDTEIWHSILQVRAIVSPPHEDASLWLKFASLSRKQERYGIACRVVEDLRNSGTATSDDPRIFLSHIKNIYACGEKENARETLREFLNNLESTVRLETPPSEAILPYLLNVSRKFPVTELLFLAKQLSRVVDEGQLQIRRRLMSRLRLRVLDHRKLLSTNQSPEVAAEFAAIGLSILDIDLLVASGHMKYVSWSKISAPRQLNIQPNISPTDVAYGRHIGWPDLINVVRAARTAVQCCPELYKTWKSWAELNFHLAEMADRRMGDSAPLTRETCPLLLQLQEEITKLEKARECIHCRCSCHAEKVIDHHRSRKDRLLEKIDQATASVNSQACLHLMIVIEAASGFIRSLGLRPLGSEVQNLLRLLVLWFRHSEIPEILAALREGFQELPAAGWIIVLPQILARLKTSREGLKRGAHLLLRMVAVSYPEALAFPLIACGSLDGETSRLLESISLQRSTNLVAKELIRISILKPEEWHEGLEEASKYFFTENNVIKSVQILLKLFNSLENPPESFAELTFRHTYAKVLAFSHLHLLRFINANAELHCLLESPDYEFIDNPIPIKWNKLFEFNHTWQTLISMFSRLTTQISRMNELELGFVSPKLKAVKDLQIAIPGQYTPLATHPTIVSFKSRVIIFPSKQRPRKILIHGSDGREHGFLLKGHEDLKQDERVMQVLSLINRLLLTESLRVTLSRRRLLRQKDGYSYPDLDDDKLSASCDSHLKISTFSVVPLSTNAGLIQWLPECDTLQSLIRKYRDKEEIKISLEINLLQSYYSRYEDLCKLQKIEAFEYTLDRSTATDLREFLWRTSENSEAWLQKRSAFTTSLAVMSVAGYVLGLGDRHPSNIMIRRESGHVVHIDFGDCFEVAMFREQHPEKVPFRLTRMFLNAMEVGAREGRFRLTSQRVLGLLRNNRDAIIATLETFVYDPLGTWRLDAPQQSRLKHLLERSRSAVTDEQNRTCESTNQLSEIISNLNSPHCTKCIMSWSERRRSSLDPWQKSKDSKNASSDETDSTVTDSSIDSADEFCRLEWICCETLRTKKSRLSNLRRLKRDGTPYITAFDLKVYAPYVNSGLSKISEHSAEQAGMILERLETKLNGTDFGATPLDVSSQFEKLLQQATCKELLAQCFIGWCPFW